MLEDVDPSKRCKNMVDPAVVFLGAKSAAAGPGAILDRIGKANATFRSLHDAWWADTTTPHDGRHPDRAGRAGEFERHLIVHRTSEGRKRANGRGVRFGRPRKLTPGQRREAIAYRDGGDETL